MSSANVVEYELVEEEEVGRAPLAAVASVSQDYGLEPDEECSPAATGLASPVAIPMDDDKTVFDETNVPMPETGNDDVKTLVGEQEWYDAARDAPTQAPSEWTPWLPVEVKDAPMEPPTKKQKVKVTKNKMASGSRVAAPSGLPPLPPPKEPPPSGAASTAGPPLPPPPVPPGPVVKPRTGLLNKVVALAGAVRRNDAECAHNVIRNLMRDKNFSDCLLQHEAVIRANGVDRSRTYS